METAKEEIVRLATEEKARRTRWKAAIAEIAPALPAALAIALTDREAMVPVAEAARALRVSAEILGRGTIVPIQRQGRRAFVKQADLDAVIGVSAADDAPLFAKLLAGAISAAMPQARARAGVELLDARETADRLGIDLKELYRQLEAGTCPVEPIRIGPRLLRWLAAAVGRAAATTNTTSETKGIK